MAIIAALREAIEPSVPIHPRGNPTTFPDSWGKPSGAWTTTTPVRHPKEAPKKDIVAIMAVHRIPYTTTTIAYPEDLMRKLEKAMGIRGAKFTAFSSPVHLLKMMWL